mgnify:CR=1 FL=1
MAKSKSSHRWLKEHFNDEYVKRAQVEGFRSRSVYKLSELQQKYRFIQPAMRVIDLGAAPGGWSEFTIKQVGKKGILIAVDILEMAPIAGVEIIQGDFTELKTLEIILQICGSSDIDLVLSDMSPNISGMASVDQPKAMYLAELALDLALKTLNKSGVFLVKLFQGEGFDEYVKLVRQNFNHVKFCKPKASRSRSKEVYLLASDFNK